MSAIFDQMLSRYEVKTTEDKHNALHEVMQQITLAALYRAGLRGVTGMILSGIFEMDIN